jgi:nicastrin
MAQQLATLLLSLVMLALVHATLANAIDDKMYKVMKSPVPCTRWLNSKGQIGCGSSASGDYGLFCPIETKADFKIFVEKKASHSHLIVVLNGELFTPEVAESLEKIHQVKGLVILTNAAPLEPYSETSSFPQANASTAGEPSDYLWNIAHHDLIHREYKFPVWSVEGSDAQSILALARMNVAQSTRYGAVLHQFMHGYKDAATCLKYKQCEPVGGHSVWGILPKPSSFPIPSNQEFVMVLSHLDAVSLFAGDAIGADADMSGLVATLSALTVLSGVNQLEDELSISQASPTVSTSHFMESEKNEYSAESSKNRFSSENHFSSSSQTLAINPRDFKYPIVWALFDAEHWGYAGSRRFLNDWTNFKCVVGRCASETYAKDFEKLRLFNARSIFELHQVGAHQPREGHPHQLYIHQHTHNYIASGVRTLVEASAGLNTTVHTASTSTPGLPPSSAFTFLDAANAANLPIKEEIIVITDHDAHYTNPFFGSRFDTAHHVNLQMVTDAATLLARALYAKAMDLGNPVDLGAKLDFIHVNASIVQAWLACTTSNVNCPLAHKFIPTLLDDSPPGSKIQRPSHYHGPFFDYAYSVLGKFAYDYMTWTSRDRSLDSTLTSCEDDSGCSSIAGSKCARGKCITSSYVQFHDSYSLGIEAKPKGGWTIVDPTLENWVEPYWDSLSFEMIHVRNPAKEAGFFVWALFQTTLFVAGIFWFKSFVKDKYELVY